MVKNYGLALGLLWAVCSVCTGAPLERTETYQEFQSKNSAPVSGQKSRKTEIPTSNYEPQPGVSAYRPSLRNTKKSDMPEKGQIKFMKTLLGKVKTLLHSDADDDGDSHKSKEKNVATHKTPEKISAVATDAGTNKMYGVLGNSKGHKTDKSVNVISIPLEALKKVVPTESYLSRGKDTGDLAHLPKSTQVVLKPISVRLANNEGNKGMTSLVPVVLQNQAPRVVPFRSDSFFPDGGNSEPYGDSRLPFIIDRHGDILKHNKADERLFDDNKGDEGLYRDIGHIPGDIRFNHTPSDDQDEESRRPSLRHKNPGRYHHDRADDDDDDDDDDEDGDEDDDDDYDDDDDDDDEDDGYDDNFDKQARFRDSPRMREEDRQLALTRKRLYDMLPGNDPTYTSENRGLGLPMRPGMMGMPEAFLGNPMIQPGVGINAQRTLMPFLGEAMAGEHADNSNDRSVFMLGGHGTRQVFGHSSSDESNTPRSASMSVNSAGFTLGGSHAQAMSPNEVSYMIQKQPGFGQLSEKDKIARPSGVLLKVNGHPIGDSRELRDHVENGVLLKGKEKLIKSKGPMDVKVSKATDGVHSKVVDITSADRVKVLEAKSKIAKTH